MNRYPVCVLAAIVSALFAGCAASPASGFYTLSPVRVAEPGPDVGPIAIAIGPVTVPELVDRP